MQGWIQMIMTNFNEEAGDLNFLPSCHDCSMVVHEPGKPARQTRIDGRILENIGCDKLCQNKNCGNKKKYSRN